MGIEERVLVQNNRKNISQILEEMAFKMKECERNEHPNAIKQDYSSQYRIRCLCPDCGLSYTRYTTDEEKTEFDRQRSLLLEPMTI